MSTIYTRVDTREFEKLRKKAKPTIVEGEHSIKDYIENKVDFYIDDLEMIIRNTLEDVLIIIKQWFKDEYDFEDEDLRNFPELDKLIYHKDGWTLKSAIQTHLESYNKWRKKADFINALNRILELESERLRNTVFDSLNEKTERFAYVTISGDHCCDIDTGICSPNYGTYEVKKHNYDLPPYHWECHCYAVYHDNPGLEVD